MFPEQKAVPKSNAAAGHLAPRLFSVAEQPAIDCTLQRNNCGTRAYERERGVRRKIVVVLKAMVDERDDPSQHIYKRIHKKTPYLPFDIHVSTAEAGVCGVPHIYGI